MRALVFVFCLIGCVASFGADADVFSKMEKQPRKAYDLKFDVFPVSTEMEMGKAWPILRKAPQGVHVSIGSERSFRGASMSPLATVLVVIDISPVVLKFVEVNRELLKSPTLKKYRHLRFEATFEEWREHCKDCLSESDFAWWVTHVRNLTNATFPLPEMLNRYSTDQNYQRALKIRRGIEKLHEGAKHKDTQIPEVADLMNRMPLAELMTLAKKMGVQGSVNDNDLKWWRRVANEWTTCIPTWALDFGYAVDMASLIDFENGNYLFDETLYNRLHKLAVSKSIHAIQLDLADTGAIERFVKNMKAFGHVVSVLDLDNLYPEAYIGDAAFSNAVQLFLDAGTDESILLTMKIVQEMGCIGFQTYFGMRFSLVKTWPKDFRMGNYLIALPREVLPQINGRLYSKELPAPYFKTWKEFPPKILWKHDL